MIIGVLKEPTPETRVSLLPEHLATLKKWNVNLYLEQHAGLAAFAPDEKYLEAGATVTNRSEVINKSDIILSINLPTEADIHAAGSKIVLGHFQSLFNASVY
jgi:NAD(P) transhydrogenase subunit alpha